MHIWLTWLARKGLFVLQRLGPQRQRRKRGAQPVVAVGGCVRPHLQRRFHLSDVRQHQLLGPGCVPRFQC